MLNGLLNDPRGTACARLALLLATALIVGFGALDFFYARSFLAQSAEFARNFGDNLAAQTWFGFFGEFWHKAASLGAVAALFFLKSKSDSLLVFYAYCVAQAVGSASKMLYQDPRPCHFDAQLALRVCLCSFGKISTNTFTGTAMYLIGAGLASAGMQPGMRVAVRLAAVFLALNVGLGSVFLGSQGWNQVVLGWLWGLWVFAAFWLLRATRSETLNAFLQREDGAQRAKRCFNGALATLFLALNAACLALWRRGDGGAAEDLAPSSCLLSCGGGAGLRARELQGLGAHNWGLPFALLWAATDAPKTLFNSFFYLQSAREAGFAVARLSVFSASALPLLVAALAGHLLPGLAGFCAASAASALFAFVFFFATPRLLDRLELDLSGDFFTGGWPLRELGGAKSAAELRVASAATL